jgi:hypothetical protein
MEELAARSLTEDLIDVEFRMENPAHGQINIQ